MERERLEEVAAQIPAVNCVLAMTAMDRLTDGDRAQKGGAR